MRATSDSLHICSDQRRMMGTKVSIQLAVPSEQRAAAESALCESFAWLTEVEAHLTRFNASSELMRLNRHTGKPFDASWILLDCLSVALEAAERTDGLYDPALLPHLEAIGYDRDFKEIAHRDAWFGEHILPETGRWREIQLDVARAQITLPPGVQIDLGGIAKGWAADYLADHLLAPYANALINIGGDLRVRGGNTPDTSWAIAIDNPLLADAENEDYLAIVTPGKGGVATSGANRRWWFQGQRINHHLIDPRTGRPARVWTPPEVERNEHAARTLIAAATAFAETAVEAEVAAKIALLRGFPDALDAVEKARTATPGTALLVALGGGQLHASLNLDAWFRHYSIEKGIWYLHS
ncbi:FAD:protein FMN transferase [Ktedonobacter racemifer]|uniref:FAD:protein FMN transferase n=1 Tax=Ktedonobacter racemifer DSM 44963 TaxID=485913 RepID=D6TCE7_KTERA|nr:FAD:protein FMN transferase [Ktedonobacter racemifer]EFH89964.1 ApbE family lipoprotein [Ktedonobacter racemifer DSM 44963]